jgi:hypothetical protein
MITKIPHRIGCEIFVIMHILVIARWPPPRGEAISG